MECNWPHLRCGSSNLGGLDGWDPHVGIMRMVYSRVQHVWTCLDMSMYVLDILDIRFYFIAHGCHSNGGEYTLMQSSRSQIAWKSSSKKVSPCDKAMEQLPLFGNM